MPRKESEAAPEGNGSIPQYVMPGITLEDFRQVMLEVWDRKLDKLTEDLRRADRRSASWSKTLSAATFCHGGRRANIHQDSRAHGERR